MEIEEKEIDGIKYVPAKAFYDMWKQLGEEIDDWKGCADNLVDYAHDFVAHLSSWGKGYDRNDKQIKLAEDAIEAYNRLKNETQSNG